MSYEQNPHIFPYVEANRVLSEIDVALQYSAQDLHFIETVIAEKGETLNEGERNYLSRRVDSAIKWQQFAADSLIRYLSDT